MNMLNRLTSLTGLFALCALCLAGCAKQQHLDAPKDLLTSAWNDYTLGEFDRAVTKFDAALEKTSEGAAENIEALYGLATTWNLRRPGEDPDKARELYQKVVDTAPKSDLAAWSALGLARMKHLVPVGQDPDYNEVRTAYQDVINRYPGHLAAKEAFIYQQATLISTLKEAETRKAIAALEQFVNTEKNNEFVGPAYSLIAVGCATLGDQEKRLQSEERSLEKTETDPTNPFTEFAWQYWNLATIAEFEVGDFNTARKYYNKLITEYPTDIRIYGAKQALKRMDDLETKIRSEL